MGGGDLVSICYSHFPIFAMANTNESLVVNLAFYLMWSLPECKLIQYIYRLVPTSYVTNNLHSN